MPAREQPPERLGERDGAPPTPPGGLGVRKAEFLAVSWSSRHVETLRPVLDELARRGRESGVLDFATEPFDAFDPGPSSLVTVGRVAAVLDLPGGLPEPSSMPHSEPVRVGAATLRVDRLLRVVASVLTRSSGCTQPSWAATERVDELVSHALRRARPRALLCCNDTSPLGHLSVRVARAHGVDTVYLQHGAWLPEQVAWAALHCHRIVVMGDHDRQLAATWVADPTATIHVLGQPRFDALATVDRERQRDDLRSALSGVQGTPLNRIAVLAAQPVSPDQLSRQVGMALEGLRLRNCQDLWIEFSRGLNVTS